MTDTKFNTLYPQREHAPGPGSLSPAAQAVLDAFENARDGEYVEGVWVVNERTMLAAALRAAADQVECIDPDDNAFAAGYDTALGDILAIAAELESADQSTSSTH